MGKKSDIPWRIKERRKRKCERGSKRGRELESWMTGFLKEMCDKGDIHGFTAHAPCSIADREGKDFTVWIKDENLNYQRVSFGVTISLRKKYQQIKHPDIPLIIIPPEMSPERIRERILKLFDDFKDDAEQSSRGY